MLLSTRQQGVPVILRELMLPDGLDIVLASFAVKDVTTELSRPRLTSCQVISTRENNANLSIRFGLHLEERDIHGIDHHPMIILL
ncbi:unnamed protein product [Schistosoma curassoni]|uniref:Transcriptional regulator n=1 Tax=Schistosoma curassoni TaxID=6186 RepID=A0A183JY68_9TREM|nr:unnamed protein product [Schistosoma curassoni]